MSYTITVVNHSPITILDGTTDTTTSITLVGKNYPNYGQLLQQDLVSMLQSWAGSSQPSNAITGQLWWNTTSNSLQIYTGSTFKTVGGATVAVTAPTSTAIQGDLWYKSDDQQLYIYSGSGWLVVGPTYSSSQQQTTAIAMSITDVTSATHVVLALFVGNQLTGILSKDPSFTPTSTWVSSYPGFSTINPGYNINVNIFTGAIPLSGQLITNAQPYITSLGTLTGLTVSTPIIGSIYNATNVTGASQPNITSTGTLTSLTSSGTITAVNHVGALNGIVGGVTPNSATFTSATINNRIIENVYVAGSVGSTYTVDWSASDVHTITLTTNCTLSFTNPPASGKAQTVTIVATQGGSGGYNLTYPASVRWSYGQAPTLTTTVSYRDVVSFITYDGGSSYLGAYSMANIAP
jgi:hypothetical protein